MALSPRRVEPFDWTAFRKTFVFQPVPVWIACALLLKPLGRATPWVLRATCEGTTRDGVANLATLAYALFLPAAAAAAVYLLAGRRRMAPMHRLMGDWCLVIVLLISALNGAALARQIRSRWPSIQPGLQSLRAACWK